MTTKGSLMDFLCKFEGNSHSIGLKFAQTKTQTERVGIQVDSKSPNGKSEFKQENR